MASRYAFMKKWLPKEWVPFEVIENLHGIQIKNDEQLKGSFQAWALQLRRKTEVLRQEEVSRHAFESFLQNSGLVPEKSAAMRLGMVVESFREVLGALEDRRLLPLNGRNYSQQVVAESLIRAFRDFFPKFKYRFFSNHSDYCRGLHKAISNDLHIKVTPAYCVTSEALGDDPADYASEIDCFTGDPVGLRYQVWLDFKKPIYLSPDVCSLKFYNEHESSLKSFVFGGREPEIPETLRIQAG